LSLTSGTLLALAFPPMPFFMLAFVAFVPILFIFSNDENPPKMYWLVYVAFFVYHAGTNWWIGSWQADTDPYLTASAIALAIAHPFFFMIPFAIFNIIKRKISTPIALNLFPFIWVAFEWAHSLGEFSYPWLTVGNTQFYNSLWVQIIDITGIWGASFLVVAANVLILRIILEIRKRKLTGVHSRIFIKRAMTFLILLVLAPIIYGTWAINRYSHEKLSAKHPSIRIGIIQPNINPWRKWEGGVEDQILMHFLVEDSLRNVKGNPDLFIWSETSVPKHTNIANLYEYYIYYDRVTKTGTSLMLGFAEIEFFEDHSKATPTARVYPWDSTLLYESYNSAMVINPNQASTPAVYRKMRLTPFAERLPYSEYLLFMRSWFEWGVGISAWGKGAIQQNLKVKTENESFEIAPIICIESIYPSFVARFTSMGASVLSVITNDAWYDYTPGPEQHYIIASLRAIENRRYLVRVANSGMSGYITPLGNSLQILPQYERAGAVENIPLMNEITLYVRFRDFLPISFLLIIIIAVIFSYYNKKSSRIGT